MTGWAMEDEEEREDRCFSACNRRWVAGMDTSDGGPCSDESLNNTRESSGDILFLSVHMVPSRDAFEPSPAGAACKTLVARSFSLHATYTDSTVECAQCIDSMWPPKENEQSALAEYSALVLSCQAEWPM